MTLLAPGSKRSEQPTRPAPNGQPPLIGLALAPPTVETFDTPPAPNVRLSGSARFGALVLLVVGLLLQRTVLTLLPWGPADLVTVLVAVLGLYAGPVAGCISGFGIGFVADAMSDHALGRLAAVLCLIGYACGMIPARRANRFPIMWLSVVVACALTPLIFALTGAFVGDDRASGSLLVTRVAAGAAYGALLAPLVYPLTRRLLGERSRRKRRISRTSP
jgi:rod shape-determining protein MreD